MKQINISFFVFYLILFISCIYEIRESNCKYDSIKDIKQFKKVISKKHWEFNLDIDSLTNKINNVRFGGIIIENGIIYFIDPISSQINSLTIKTGSVRKGNQKYLKKEIDNIAFFSGYIFAITYGAVIIIDSNLNVCRYDTLPHLKGKLSHFHDLTPDSIIIFYDWWEFMDTISVKQKYYQEFIKYNKSLKYDIITYPSTSEKTHVLYNEDQFRKIRGKPFKRIKEMEIEWLNFDNIALEIPDVYSKLLSVQTMDFDESHIVFWTINEKEKIYKIILLNYKSN